MNPAIVWGKPLRGWEVLGEPLLGLGQTFADGIANQASGPVNIQLFHDPGAMGLGGLDAHPQNGSDFLGGLALGNELQDLPFPVA